MEICSDAKTGMRGAAGGWLDRAASEPR